MSLGLDIISPDHFLSKGNFLCGEPLVLLTCWFCSPLCVVFFLFPESHRGAHQLHPGCLCVPRMTMAICFRLTTQYSLLGFTEFLLNLKIRNYPKLWIFSWLWMVITCTEVWFYRAIWLFRGQSDLFFPSSLFHGVLTAASLSSHPLICFIFLSFKDSQM